MFAMGLIGFLAGIFFRRGLLRRTRGALAVFGAISAIVIYGGIMNPASALMAAQEINWRVLLTYYISGFSMDCVHAGSGRADAGKAGPHQGEIRNDRVEYRQIARRAICLSA